MRTLRLRELFFIFLSFVFPIGLTPVFAIVLDYAHVSFILGHQPGYRELPNLLQSNDRAKLFECYVLASSLAFHFSLVLLHYRLLLNRKISTRLSVSLLSPVFTMASVFYPFFYLDPFGIVSYLFSFD